MRSVTDPLSTDRRPAGAHVHVSRTLTPRDLRHHLGIRVTSPARTLLDMAAGLVDLELARAVNYVTVRTTWAAADRRP